MTQKPASDAMPNLADKQFSLSGDGRILFQCDPSNPLPGVPVATLRKGQGPFAPEIDLTDPAGFTEADAFTSQIKAWLGRYVSRTLEPLLALENLAASGGSVGGDIALKLLDGFGVVPRADMAEAIGALDPEGRTVLRQKKVRLGPAFVYLLEGNKPAAVRLRGLLWALWREKPVPAFPHDGAVSQTAPEGETDPAWWVAIGYPLCGPRIVRVDMHDRLVQAIYDRAEKGIFRARHDMAEWLGCSISDLYAVLEALGHRRIEEPPAPVDKIPTMQEDKPQEDKPAAAPGSAEEEQAPPASAIPGGSSAQPQSAAEAQDAVPAPEPPAPLAKTEAPKPDLALFRLRRARPELAPRPASAHPRPPGPPRKERTHDKKDTERDSRRARNESQDSLPRRGRRKGPEREREREPRPERIMRAEARIDPEDSPFAILKNFKLSGS